MLAAFRQRSLTATEAAGQLGVTGSRLYMLATDYLRACARKEADSWLPGTSGGDHTTTWPKPPKLTHSRFANYKKFKV